MASSRTPPNLRFGSADITAARFITDVGRRIQVCICCRFIRTGQSDTDKLRWQLRLSSGALCSLANWRKNASAKLGERSASVRSWLIFAAQSSPLKSPHSDHLVTRLARTMTRPNAKVRLKNRWRRHATREVSLADLGRLVSCEGAHAVDVSASCARPFRANVLMKSVSRAMNSSSIFRLNGGCANCSRLRTNTLH